MSIGCMQSYRKGNDARKYKGDVLNMNIIKKLKKCLLNLKE